MKAIATIAAAIALMAPLSTTAVATEMAEIDNQVHMIPLPPPRPVAVAPAARPAPVRAAETTPAPRRVANIWLSMGFGF